METYRSQEPYRATRLWNEVILAFRTGMPLKRHRRRMRYYDDCFTATDCISWLNCYLKNNPNFGPEVTRQQTIQLLQKFLKSHVIKRISSKSKNLEISDNSHLYRFVEYSPQKCVKNSALQTLLRTPLHDINTQDEIGNRLDFTPKCYTMEVNKYGSLNSKERILKENQLFSNIKEHLPECHLVVRTLAVEEIECIWKTITIARLEALLYLSKLENLMDSKEVSGRLIMHNINRVSKSGVITLIDKTDDIPHWVISAMKCLANWPNASGSGSCLPNYPGFETDVFKVVRDFFINPGMPLIPSTLYPVIARAFGISEQKNCLNNSVSNCSLENSTGLFYMEASSGELVCSEAVRNISETDEQKTSTPVFHSSVYLDDDATKLTELPNRKDELHGQSAEGRMILDDPNVMWDYPLTLCYETEFTAVSPVTRIIPTHSSLVNIKGSHTSLHTLNSHTAESVDTVSTISACSHITKNSVLHQPNNPVHISNLVQAKKLVFSADELHCSLNRKDCYNKSSLNMTVKQISLDDLSNLSDNYETPKWHAISGISTLPRMQKISASTLNENKDFSSIRQLKRENVQRREHIKNSLEVSKNCNMVHSDSFLELNNSINNTFEKNLSKCLCSNSFQTSKDDLSWISCESKSRTNSSNASQVCDVRKHLFPLGHEQSIKSTNNNTRNIYKINENFQSKLSECKMGKLDECRREKVNSNRSKLLGNSEQSVQQQSFSCNVGDEESKQRICEVLQVLLLFLPPANRRQLHLLFRMINKILKNGKLLLDPTISTKNLLLETFSPTVIYSENKAQFTKSSVLHIVSFMLEKCEVIFQPPAALKEEVETRLAAMKRGRQYEHQKVSLSRQALVDLLESIIQNEHLSEKEKRKKLKQFKTNYPEIYLERFPSGEAKISPKHKKALLTRFLSLRM